MGKSKRVKKVNNNSNNLKIAIVCTCVVIASVFYCNFNTTMNTNVYRSDISVTKEAAKSITVLAENGSLFDIPKDIVLDQYRISSYLVDSVTGSKQLVGMGSAVGIDKRRVITANHVVENPELYYVLDMFNNDGILSKHLDLRLVRRGFADFALLETSEDLPHYLKPNQIGSSKELQVGDPVYKVGAKFGKSPYDINIGYIANKGDEEFPKLWQTSIPVAGGDSGGGIYDARTHKLVGIAVMTLGNELSLIVPIEAFIHDMN